MKKYLPVLVMVTLIVPSVAFASWWNPTSWGIWSFFFGGGNSTSSQVVVQSTSTTAIQVADISTSSNRASNYIATTTIVASTSVISKTAQVPLKISNVESEHSYVSDTESSQPASASTSLNISVTTSQETQSDLLIKMTSLKQAVETVMQGIVVSDYSDTQLSFIHTKISGDVINFSMENHPSDQEIKYYLTQYTDLKSQFDSLPPIIYSLNNGSISIGGVISGYGFSGASSVYITAVNPSNTDIPIKLPFIVTNNWTMKLNLYNVYIPAKHYYLYVVNSLGKQNAPFQTYVSDDITPQQELNTSTSASTSTPCQTAQQNLKLSIQDGLTTLQQTYLQQVQTYCQ